MAEEKKERTLTDKIETAAAGALGGIAGIAAIPAGREGLKADYEKAVDGIAAGMEKENELGARLAGKLGGPEARRLAEEATVDGYKLHFKDEMKEALKADKLMAEGTKEKIDNFAINTVAKLGGPEAVAHEMAGIKARDEGHLIDMMKEGFKVDGVVARAAEKKIDNFAINTVAKLGGPEAVAHEMAGIKARDEGHLLDMMKEGFKVDGVVLNAGLKKVESLFGPSSVAPQQPSPTNPTNTPVNLGSENKSKSK